MSYSTVIEELFIKYYYFYINLNSEHTLQYPGVKYAKMSEYILHRTTNK